MNTQQLDEIGNPIMNNKNWQRVYVTWPKRTQQGKWIWGTFAWARKENEISDRVVYDTNPDDLSPLQQEANKRDDNNTWENFFDRPNTSIVSDILKLLKTEIFSDKNDNDQYTTDLDAHIKVLKERVIKRNSSSNKRIEELLSTKFKAGQREQWSTGILTEGKTKSNVKKSHKPNVSPNRPPPPAGRLNLEERIARKTLEVQADLLARFHHPLVPQKDNDHPHELRKGDIWTYPYNNTRVIWNGVKFVTLDPTRMTTDASSYFSAYQPLLPTQNLQNLKKNEMWRHMESDTLVRWNGEKFVHPTPPPNFTSSDE